MSFRDKFLGISNNNVERPEESALVVSEQVNDERLIALRREVKSAFDQGIERLSQSQLHASAVLQGEIAYQAERLGTQLGQLIQDGSTEISTAVEQSSADIVAHIQRMSDYLGAAFSDIRWAVERQTQITQESLHAILNSLDNQSRQYFEQGVECYEMGEYEMANERFARALEADPTNHFVYQYLGFMAVAEDRPEDAIRNFALARKFAKNSYHQALALAHLARSHYATGHLHYAADLAHRATQTHSDTAKFWYESAGYHARIGAKEKALTALREAIQRDWTYWAVILSDTDFDGLHEELEVMLGELRQGEKAKAQQALDALQNELTEASRAGLSEQITTHAATHHSLSQRLGQENVYVFQDVARSANEQRQQIQALRAKQIREQIAQGEARLGSLSKARAKELQEADAPLATLKEIRSYINYSYYPLHAGPTSFIGMFFIAAAISFYFFLPRMDGSPSSIAVWLVVSFVGAWVLILVSRPLHRWFYLQRPRRRVESHLRKRRKECDEQQEDIKARYAAQIKEAQNELSRLHHELQHYEQVAVSETAEAKATTPIPAGTTPAFNFSAPKAAAARSGASPNGNSSPFHP